MDPLDPKQPIEVSSGEVVLVRPFSTDVRRVRIADLVQEFSPYFEGIETERNWQSRQNSIVLLRKLTCSPAPSKYNTAYVAVIKSMHASIIKALLSLRTTLAANGIRLVTEAFETCGRDLDSIFELIIQPLTKQCGNTKSQTASEASIAVTTALTNTTYSPRLLHHISVTMDEKSKGLRGFAISWLDAILLKYNDSKHMLEEKSGANTIEAIVTRGLTDPDATVRSKSEVAYWNFDSLWHQRAELLMESLPATKQKSLQAHKSNIHVSSLNTKTKDTIPRKGHSTARTTTATGHRTEKPSLRDHIQAQKKAMKFSDDPFLELAQEEIQAEKSQSTNEQRPKSAGSTTGAAPPAKPLRPAVRPIPSRPKTAAATASSSLGTMSSAPKRPMIAKKTASTFASNIDNATKEHDTARDFITNPGPTEGASTNSFGIKPTIDLKRGRPLAAIANPPGSPTKIPISSKVPSRSVSPDHADHEVSSGVAEPELTSGFLRVLKGLVSDRSCQVPSDALGVLAKALRCDDVVIRREGVELGVALNQRMGHALFDMVPELDSSEKDLLLYYITKKR